MVRTFGVLFAACVGIVTIASSASARTEPAPGCRWCGIRICCKEEVVMIQGDHLCEKDEKPSKDHRGSGRIADVVEPVGDPAPTSTGSGGTYVNYPTLNPWRVALGF